MESITPPDTPSMPAKPTRRELLQQLQTLQEQMTRMETLAKTILRSVEHSEPDPRLFGEAASPTSEHSVNDSTSMTCSTVHSPDDLTSFWAAQDLSEENLDKMKLEFRHAMLYGPERRIVGVRPRAGPDLPPRDDHPPTALSVLGPERHGVITMRRLSLPLMEYGSEKTWHAWDLGVERLINHWPVGVPAFILNDPGHFEHDWSFFKGTCVVLNELSYDKAGVPEQVFWKFREKDGSIGQGWQLPSYARSHQPNREAVGRIFGRSWRVCPEEPVLSVPLCAFIFSQVTRGHDIEAQEMAKCGSVFLKKYTAVWPRTPWTRWCCVSENMAHLQFHIRYLSISYTPITQPRYQVHTEGLSLCRTKVLAPVFGGCDKTPIIEERISVAINTSLRSNVPHYTVTMLADSPELLNEHVDGDKRWRKSRLSVYGELTGVAVFQSILYQAVREWAKSWTSTLDHSPEVGDFPYAHPGEKTTLESYAQWIEATTADLDSIRADSNASFNEGVASDQVRRNWDTLVSYQAGLANQLLDQISQKIKDLAG